MMNLSIVKERIQALIRSKTPAVSLPMSRPPAHAHSRFNGKFALIVLALNLSALGLMFVDVVVDPDRRYGWMWAAVFFVLYLAPIANGLLAVFGLLAIPFVYLRPGFSAWKHVSITIGLPLLAVGFDWAAVVWMASAFCSGLGGC